jgi:hypothetical protein
MAHGGYETVTRRGADNEGDFVRHLYGTALAIVMSAVMFFAGAWGYLRLLKLPVPPGETVALPAGGGSLLGNSTALLSLAAVMATAILAGVLVMVPWFSPLAAGLPGLLVLAWTGLYLASVQRAVQFIPLRSHAFGAGWEALLFNGILGAVGAVMIFPLFIPSRWRRPRLAAEGARSETLVEEYLSTPTLTPDSVPRQPQERQPRERQPQARQPRERQREEQEQPPLVGTVMSRPAGVQPVDTTRVTGASRALRATGSFRAATGSFRAAAGPAGPAGPMLRDGHPGHPGQQRETGSFRAGGDTGLLGRPYYKPEA